MFEIVMGIDDFLIQLVKYCNRVDPKVRVTKFPTMAFILLMALQLLFLIN